MRKKQLLFLTSIMMLIIILIGCSSSSGSGSEKQLSLATASTGGTYYPIGGGIAELVNTNVDGYRMTAESTGGSFENISLLEDKESDFAIMETGVGALGYSGNEAMFDKSYENLRFIGSMWSNLTHLIVPASSDINTVENLKGKSLAVGGPGSAGIFASEVLLSIYGLTFDDIDARKIPYSEGANQLRDGHIDATIVAGGIPVAAAIDLTSTTDIKFIDLDPKYEEELKEEHPYFFIGKTPKGTYNGQDEDTYGIGVKNALYTHAEAPDEIVYEVTRLIYEKTDELVKVHDAAKNITIDEALVGQGDVPLHPGAEQYYKEKGILE